MKNPRFFLSTVAALSASCLVAQITVTKTGSPAFAVTNVNSLTAAATTNLTLSAGSTGANFLLGQGTSGNVTITAGTVGNPNIYLTTVNSGETWFEGGGLGFIPSDTGPLFGVLYGGMQYREPVESMANNFFLFRGGGFVVEDEGANWKFYVASNGFVNIGSGAGATVAEQPLSNLEVAGNLAVGAAYARTTAAPTNGLLVQGNTLVGAASTIGWVGQSIVSSPGNGTVKLTNAAGNDFARLIFALDTSSGVALRRTLTTIDVVLGDDSNYANFRAMTITEKGGGFFVAGAGTPARLNTLTSTYGAGTAYALTATPAAIDLGTTDPVVTIPTTGTYTIRGSVQLLYNAATFAGNQTVTLKFRRTNNTAADLTNGTIATTTQIITALTYTYGVFPLPQISYNGTAGDIITIFADVSATPGAGSLDAVASGTWIAAQLEQ
jgi:hypothetical protein